jgi:hypothetical protein
LRTATNPSMGLLFESTRSTSFSERTEDSLHFKMDECEAATFFRNTMRGLMRDGILNHCTYFSA